VKFNFDVTGTY